MWRPVIVVLMLVFLGGCAQPQDLPDITIRAGTPSELISFKTELAKRFTPEQLLPFDTAQQELVLDAMHRNVETAAARELDMCAVVNGRTVHATLVLGWTARRERLLREAATVNALLERDLKRREKYATADIPASISANIQNEQIILARLHRDLTATEEFLGKLRAAKSPVP